MDLKSSSHIPNEFCYQEPQKGLLLSELAHGQSTTTFYRQILLTDQNLCEYYLLEGLISRDETNGSEVVITNKGREYLLLWQEKNKQHHANT